MATSGASMACGTPVSAARVSGWESATRRNRSRPDRPAATVRRVPQGLPPARRVRPGHSPFRPEPTRTPQVSAACHHQVRASVGTSSPYLAAVPPGPCYRAGFETLRRPSPRRRHTLAASWADPPGCRTKGGRRIASTSPGELVGRCGVFRAVADSKGRPDLTLGRLTRDLTSDTSLYEIREREPVVVVVKVGHRRGVVSAPPLSRPSP